MDLEKPTFRRRFWKP